MDGKGIRSRFLLGLMAYFQGRFVSFSYVYVQDGSPSFLEDLKDDGRPSPPGIDPARFKIIRMEGVQIRALIGKGGETIKDIRFRSGADIKIDHLPSDPEGNVTIVGDVEKTEIMIKEALTTKGCPLVPKPQVPPPPPPDAGIPGMPGMPGVPPPLETNENEIIELLGSDVVQLVKEQLEAKLCAPIFRQRLLNHQNEVISTLHIHENDDDLELQVLLVPFCQEFAEELLEAATAGDGPWCRVLLEKPQQPDGRGALHAAARYGHAEVVQLLLQARAWQDQPGRYEATPLLEAAESGTLKVAEILVDAKSDLNQCLG
eukprot:symbB.v1.2.021892.t3/scaffold1916.1/size96221/7